MEQLRNTFAAQLQQTNTEITALQNQLKMLEMKREQLKGAVYALDTALAEKAAANQEQRPSDQEQTITKEQEPSQGENNG